MAWDAKVWVRLKLSTLLAAINALRYFGKDRHDDARVQEAAGDIRLSEHTRAEAEYSHTAAREIDNEKERVYRDGGTLDAAVSKESKGE